MRSSHYYKLNFSIRLNLLLLLPTLSLAVIAVCACNKPSPKVQALAYDKVIDSANRIYDYSENQQKAIAYLDKVTSNYHQLSIDQKFDNYSIHYNYYFHMQHNNTAALLYADSMLTLFKTTADKLQYTNLYSKAYFYKGDVLFTEGRYNKAYSCFYRGKLIGSQNKNLPDCTISDYNYFMGMILYKQNSYQLAAEHFIESFKETCTCKFEFRSFYRRQELLSNIGICYAKINKTDSAHTYFQKALNYINTQGVHFSNTSRLLDVARAVVYGNEASLFIEKKQYNQAKALLKKSFDINLRKDNDHNDAILSELKLVHIYQNENQVDSMLARLTLIKSQINAAGSNDDASADWNSLMAYYYEQKNNLHQALAYYKQYITAKNKGTQKLLALKAINVSDQLNRFEKDYELNELKRDNQTKSLYLIVAIVFVLMALLIIFLIYQYWLKSKKNLHLLSELNAQINKQNLELEKALTDLKMSSEEKDRILRTVAHDLRNPVGGIASLTNMMVEDDGNTEEQKAYLKIIKDTANNSLELISEILEATNDRMGTGSRQWIDINVVVKSSVELLRFKAAEKNQQIILETLDKPETLFINREKIWRVISNLISNAIKFSLVDSVIKIKIADKKSEVIISVQDEGIGIPDHLKASIFNMFTAAKRAGTLGEKSFGLGLSICRQIIENHQGKIWFESNGTAGTTFYISLNKTSEPV